MQRNATSSFEYDGLDRVVRALVRHEYVYPLVALVEEVNAYEYGVRSIVSYAPGGAVENSIEFRYDPNNKLASETQSHESKKNWSKAVAYSYEADGGYPVPRLSGITYPSGRTVTYLCAKGTADWSRKDWATGRVSRVEDQGAGSPAYVFYEDYQGLGSVLKITYEDHPTGTFALRRRWRP